MPKLIKIILSLIGVVLVLILLMWVSAAVYIATHRKEVLEKTTSLINDKISGKLTIESMEPSLIQGFPGISVSLKNILLQDSLVGVHKHPVLKASRAFISVNAFSLIKGEPEVQTIKISDGEIYFFTDSTGYRNTQVFKSNPKGKSKSSSQINKVQLDNVKLTFENKIKGKLFDFSIQKFSGKIKYKEDSWQADVQVHSIVNSLTFRREKGSFIRGKRFKGNLQLEYDEKQHVLSLQNQNIYLDDDRIKVDAKFTFAPMRPAFVLNLQAENILFQNALSLLTPKIFNKLKVYNLSKPFLVKASIKGKLKGPDIPLVNVSWKTAHNIFHLPGEVIKDCSFSGDFTNEVTKGKLRKDPNSSVGFKAFKGTWSGINFIADTLLVKNLAQPVLEGRFSSNFSLAQINTISESETFHINKGNATLQLHYKAPFNRKASTEPFINGLVKIKDAELMYVPRSLKFQKVNGLIRFKGQHLFMDMQVESASSRFFMNGSVRNFVNFYYSDPKRILLDWHVKSPQISLAEFLAFLGPRRKSGVSNPRSKVRNLFGQLNNVLDEASVHVDLQAEKLSYKRFEAQNVKSDILLNEAGIHINNVSLNHAGGSLKINGNFNQGNTVNKFNIDTRLFNVDIRKLFFAFNDFGQTAITYENIRGNLSARTQVTGLLKNNGQVVPKSFFGTIDFNLKEGALVNFEPMEKVGNFAFRKRNFSNITFNNLTNTLDVKGDKIIIPKMIIQSSVLNMVVEGVYGMSAGTDIALAIPIRNPEKDVFLPDSIKEKRLTRGIVINLNAVDDGTGNVKIRLGKSKKDEDD